ncbi:MAG: hypothetical protein EOP84_22580 [Verrucomicrobiaceae bacterium]|nr:MAG: hypothetical protein EOP84_22580 [Verrucomicrobiaceae bacterium]
MSHFPRPPGDTPKALHSASLPGRQWYYPMNVLNQPNDPPVDISWPMLLSIAAVVVGSLYLLSYSVFYTQSELVQGFFALIVCMAGGSVFLGFYQRRMAVWCVTLIGGSLLLWQTYQTRKWAVIHEDVVSIVRFIEEKKRETGHYPASLDHYTFKRETVKSHIYGLMPDDNDGVRLLYFMNDASVMYWYSTKTGFGYYPD